MKYIENSYIELKQIVNTDLKKEIIAFANTDGGEIYIGITKTGEVIGIENSEMEMERISNMIRDGIKPDLTSYTSINTIQDQNKSIIKITVSRGEKRPYHISEKGLKPSGVYVRRGVTSAPASDEAIRQMIKDSDGTSFDKVRSVNQDLSFEFAEKYFSDRKIKFEDSNKRSLGLINADGYFTNAALLLSDQCEHSIKCAIYDGKGKTNFKSRKEFFGSILKQMEEAYEYISLSNSVHSSFEGLRRIDVLDYPEYAIREALLNTVVHRDYDYSGSTLISIFTDRIEFVSIGGLVKGITLTDIMRGVSQTRNTVVANIFYRLELIESYGTGIQRIIESYELTGLKPIFETAAASFVVILPNIRFATDNLPDKTLSYDERVLKLLSEKDSITRKDIEILLNCSSFPANKTLNSLLKKDEIIRIGAARTTKYIRK